MKIGYIVILMILGAHLFHCFMGNSEIAISYAIISVGLMYLVSNIGA